MLNLTFEERVRAMSAKEIIMAMVDGLRNPAVKVNMTTFGCVVSNICYGCAATNTICKISNIKLDSTNIDSSLRRACAVNCKLQFLSRFEDAINDIRCGRIFRYNMKADVMRIAKITHCGFELPFLTDSNYIENLHYYEELAQLQGDK